MTTEVDDDNYNDISCVTTAYCPLRHWPTAAGVA